MAAYEGSANIVSTLSGNFKEIYANEIINLIKYSSKLTDMVPFTEGTKIGNKYHQPVVVSDTHGFTYAAPGDGVFELNFPKASRMQDAQVDGYQIVLRDAFDQESASKASSSKKAFKDIIGLMTQRMTESMGKRLEIEFFYGQSASGIGLISASTNPSAGTTATWTISAATFAPEIWSGSEGAELDVYVSTSKQNSNAVVVVTAVDIANRTVSVSGNNTDLVAIYAAGSPTGYILYKGSYGKSMAGLDKIITNTGTLFNIDAATWNLWKGNTLSVSGQLTLQKVLQGVNKAVSRGLSEDVVVFLNPSTWVDLASDDAALRSFDSSYSPSKSESGSKSLVYYGQNGKLSIESHGIVKAGECFILPVKRLKRIGAQEVSFNSPKDEQVFFPLANHMGYEMRLSTDQAIFCEKPATLVKLYGFSNAS